MRADLVVDSANADRHLKSEHPTVRLPGQSRILSYFLDQRFGKGVTSGCSEVPEEGLEPTRPCGHWILSPAIDLHNTQAANELRDVSQTEVPTMVPWFSELGDSAANLPPDLIRVVAAWDQLPHAIRIAILALVQAAGGDVV